MKYSTLLTIMVNAVESAGKRLARDFGELEHLQIAKKPPKDFINKSVNASEETLLYHLQKARPKYTHLSPQYGYVKEQDNSNCWIINPLSGFVNFIHGFPLFAISIALERDKKPYAGVIYNPISDQMWLAEEGQGAWTQNRRIRVSQKKYLTEALHYTEAPRMEQKEREAALKRATILSKLGGETRDIGSSALAMAYFASGQFESLFLENQQPWDIAAGLIIATEAGGFIRDFDGNKNMLEKGEVIATNLTIDPELNSLLGKYSLSLPLLK